VGGSFAPAAGVASVDAARSPPEETSPPAGSTYDTEARAESDDPPSLRCTISPTAAPPPNATRKSAAVPRIFRRSRRCGDGGSRGGSSGIASFDIVPPLGSDGDGALSTGVASTTPSDPSSALSLASSKRRPASVNVSDWLMFALLHEVRLLLV
jgi:hypothetical protein